MIKPSCIAIYITTLILFVLSKPALAQTDATYYINSDRPDQTGGTTIIPHKHFQIENGIWLEHHTVLNNFMLRYGLAKTTELRLGLDAGKAQNIKGILPMALSVKQFVMPQRGVIPAFAVIGNLYYGKIATKSFQNKDLNLDINLAFENELTKQFALAYNLGMSENFNVFNGSFEGSYSPDNTISFYLEYFCNLYQKSWTNNIDAGVFYRITPALQLDAAYGRYIHTPNPDFMTVGLSYYFK